ncbi:MAG: PAS domain-containing protein, partial [Candidatus Eremiobacteraeota bacterium]|nr:PAS domain-containing protein [Candidatus Eremiobacteraeota bacterium]
MPFSKIKNDSRLKALKETQLLDTPPDYKFDRFTQLVTTILDVPVCLFSLVTPDRQFFKSQSGLNEPWSVLRQTPLSHSFCRHVVETDQSLIVEDARVHPLLKNNPAITSLSVVAYAGFPISTPEGFVLGSFCAIDDKPRKWSIRDVAVMKGFTEAIESEIGLQLELHRRKRAEERLRDESERYRVKLEAEVTSRTAELLAALARSQAVEERFETLMKRTPQAIAMFDRNLCYLHYSERWIEDYRLQAQLPLTGRCHYDVFPTIPERWKAHHRRALTGESLSNQEDSFLREDGSREWLRWELVPWREANGEIGGLIMLTEVMTQRRIEQAELRQMKHLERQLREAQKMGTLGLLAGGLAHDLNNILCGILLPAEMSKHELPSSHPLQDDLTTIYEAGRRAERLVKQLLVFTRRQPTEPKVVDVNQVVENFRGILSRLLPKRIQLHVNLPATPLPKVMIDPSALEQVILNLVVNAKDAMPEGGTVSIEVEV